LFCFRCRFSYGHDTVACHTDLQCYHAEEKHETLDLLSEPPDNQGQSFGGILLQRCHVQVGKKHRKAKQLFAPKSQPIKEQKIVRFDTCDFERRPGTASKA